MDEDKDFEQDSEEYRRWRQGDDNDRYASSRTPTETGAQSGEYKLPPSTGTTTGPYQNQGENSGEKIFWIGIAVAILLVFGSGIIGIYLFISSGEEVASWPTTEGSISGTDYTDGWKEKCEEDDYGDEYCDDVFFCEIKVIYNFTVENQKYFSSETIGGEGEPEDQCQVELENKYDIDGTVTVHYNPDDPKENYIEKPPSSALAFVFCAFPFIILIMIAVAFSAVGKATGYSDPFSRGFSHRGWNRRRGFGFGGFRGRRGRRRSGARRRTTRTRSRRR